MALRSKRFQNDPRLEACLVQNSSHVMLGAVGNYVSKIQQALQLLDGSIIAPAEIAAQRYGPSTAAAVKAFKRKHEIIDWSRQDKADDIVGKMTIAFLDKEMEEEEKTILIRVNAHLLTLTITTYHYVQRQVRVGNTWVTQTVRVEDVERVEPGRNQEGIRLDFLGLNFIYREAGIFLILGEVTTGSLEAPDRQGQVGANRALLDTGGQIFVSARVPGTTCPRWYTFMDLPIRCSWEGPYRARTTSRSSSHPSLLAGEGCWISACLSRMRCWLMNSAINLGYPMQTNWGRPM